LMYEAMIRAGQAANEKGIPVIFDPVGVGATPFRTKRAKDFIEKVKVSIVRGNASEVHALIGGEVHTRGVDSGVVTLSSQEITLLAAKQLNAIAVISGKQDYVSDGNEMIGIDNGDIWLTKITGTGCTTASLIASFAGVTNDLLLAAVAGMSTMSLAGELAKKRLALEDGLGTYRVNLMDELSLMNGERWEVGVRLI
jgi:hydroxyethylthiazole kinase